MELLVPLLAIDAVVGWMLWSNWRKREVWIGWRMGRKEDNRGIYWFSQLRLIGLFALSLVGTVAAWRAV